MIPLQDSDICHVAMFLQWILSYRVYDWKLWLRHAMLSNNDIDAPLILFTILIPHVSLSAAASVYKEHEKA